MMKRDMSGTTDVRSLLTSAGIRAARLADAAVPVACVVNGSVVRARRLSLGAVREQHGIRVRSTFGVLVMTIGIATLSGCSMLNGTSAKQAVAQVDWSAADDAILIQVDADDRLNETRNEPHTLLFGVVQMADPAAFQKLA